MNPLVESYYAESGDHVPIESRALVLLEKISHIIPNLAAHDLEFEKTGTIPEPDLWLMWQAGIFEMGKPVPMSGCGLRPSMKLHAIEQIAKVSPSVGWCAVQGAHMWPLLAYVDPRLGKAIEKEGRSILSVVLRPGGGRAVKTNNGFIVSGQWPFASGSKHCDLFAGGCMVYEERSNVPIMTSGGMPEMRVCFVSPQHIEVLDTWNTLALRATGSHDVRIENVFVSYEHTFSLNDPRTRRPHDYWTRYFPLFFAEDAGVAVGIARRALGWFQKFAQTKLDIRGKRIALDTRVQDMVGQATGRIDRAKRYLMNVLMDIEHTLVDAKTLSKKQRMLYRFAMMEAFQDSLHVVELLYKAAGSSSVYIEHPITQCLLDIKALRTHVILRDEVYGEIGRLTLDPDADIFLPLL